MERCTKLFEAHRPIKWERQEAVSSARPRSIKTGRSAWTIALVLLACWCCGMSAQRAQAATFVVTSTVDPGAGGCTAASVGDGCTLREAITAANGNANPTITDTISFNIAGGGVKTIVPLTNLPNITEAVNIDGYTQPGAAAATATTPATILIELNGAGLAADGLLITASNSIVRGLAINRFGGEGIALLDGSGNAILGCYIGTDVTGTTDLGNGGGVGIVFAKSNLIGGTTPGARNVISGNGAGGVNIIGTDATATGNTVQGNYIGTNAAGTAALGNGLNGVDIRGTSGNTVGGTATGAGNIISNNGGNGVSVSDNGTGINFTGNQIFGNSISRNDLLGIDFLASGETGGQVTSNDFKDLDTGPNNLQNYPTLSAITQSGSTSSVTGNLNSTPNRTFALDFYSNSEADPSGFGEGEKYLGAINVTTDFRGDAPFAFPLSGVGAGQFITATATDTTTSSTGEFSNALLVQFSGSLQFAQPNFAAQEGTGNATITVSRTGGTEGAVSVNYATGNGTAIAGSDYTSTSGTLNFAVGQSSATFTVPILDDSVVENDETVNLTLSNPLGGAGLGTPINATLTIVDNDSAQPGNASPVADDQSLTTPRNTPRAIVLSGRDSDTPAANLNYRIVTPPANGALSGTAPNLTYTPNANFAGPDNFAFVINDGNSDSNLATIALQVLAPPVNNSPVADDQTLTTPRNTARAITLIGRDSDTPTASLTYRLVTPPANGTLTGTAPNVTYTPANNFVGPDSFAFVINDGSSDSNLATITLQVLAGTAPPPSVNNAPVADDQSRTTPKNTALALVLSGRDSDTPVANFTYRIITPPQNGVLSGTAPNLTYTPRTDFVGPDSFAFVINDGSSDSNLAIISLQVLAPPIEPPVIVPPVIVPPLAVDDNYTLVYGPASQVQSPDVTLMATGVFKIDAPGLLGNDRDSQNRPLSARLASYPKHGRIQVRSDGSFFYLPNGGFAGVDEFAYTLSNGQSTALGKVTLKIIDRIAPELRFDTPANGATLKTVSEIKGRTRDLNSGLKSLTLVWRRFDGKFWNGSAWMATLTELPLKVDGINWSYEGTLPELGDNAASDLLDGAYAMRVSATDKSGNTSRVVNRFKVGSSAPNAPVSAVRLSAAGASLKTIELRFTGALDEDALQNDPDFSVLLGGDGVFKANVVAYRGNTVTLSGFDLEAGQEIQLRIGDLRDATGKTIKGGTIKLVAR